MKNEELRERAQTWLLAWFAGRAKMGRNAEKELLQLDYFAAGWLSSMEVVEFVMEMERHFGIQFSEADMQDHRFVTIAGLSEVILERSTKTEPVR
jgi:acyl carrier protein